MSRITHEEVVENEVEEEGKRCGEEEAGGEITVWSKGKREKIGH